MINNMKLVKTIILFLSTFSSLVCIAQSGKLTGDSYSKAHPTEKIKLKSSYVSDREYIIHITYAMDSLIPGKKYPVLYYTDAWTNVDYFNLMGKVLSDSKEIDPVILVGISFDANFDEWIKLRAQDLWLYRTNPDSTNGAKNFLKFIKKELLPYVEQHYPADSNDRGFYGYSIGGFFATWILKEDPMLFKRIGIGSPSLGYKDYLLLKDQTLLNNISVLQDLKVFVEYGTLESEKTKKGAETLYRLLKANENIQVTKFILDGSHFSAWPETCVKALTHLYEKKKESN